MVFCKRPIPSSQKCLDGARGRGEGAPGARGSAGPGQRLRPPPGKPSKSFISASYTGLLHLSTGRAGATPAGTRQELVLTQPGIPGSLLGRRPCRVLSLKTPVRPYLLLAGSSLAPPCPGRLRCGCPPSLAPAPVRGSPATRSLIGTGLLPPPTSSPLLPTCSFSLHPLPPPAPPSPRCAARLDSSLI